MDEKCENCDERYECNSGLGCLKAMSPQPAPSEPQGEPLIGGGRVDPETGIYTANEKRLGGISNPTKNMPFTLRNGTVLNKQPAPSGPPVEPGVFDLTVRLEVYKVDISGAYRECPPDVRLFAMFNGHEFEVGKLNGQWSKPKEPE